MTSSSFVTIHLLFAALTTPIIEHLPDLIFPPVRSYNSSIKRYRMVVKFEEADVQEFHQARLGSVQSRVEERWVHIMF